MTRGSTKNRLGVSIEYEGVVSRGSEDDEPIAGTLWLRPASVRRQHFFV